VAGGLPLMKLGRELVIGDPSGAAGVRASSWRCRVFMTDRMADISVATTNKISAFSLGTNVSEKRIRAAIREQVDSGLSEAATALLGQCLRKRP
jgi:hypothetical protein